MTRFCLLVTLALMACYAISTAAGDKPLGWVTMSTQGTMDNAKAATGTTIFSGDSFSTAVGGALSMTLGKGAGVTLRSQSSALVLLDGDRTKVSLQGGTVQFHEDQLGAIQIETPMGTLEAANGQAINGDVTILNMNSILVTDRKGVLVLKHDGETHSLVEGKAYNVRLAAVDPNAPPEPAAAQAAQGAGTMTTHKHKDRLIFDVVLFGGAATTAGCLWNTAESPSSFCGGVF